MCSYALVPRKSCKMDQIVHLTQLHRSNQVLRFYIRRYYVHFFKLQPVNTDISIIITNVKEVYFFTINILLYCKTNL